MRLTDMIAQAIQQMIDEEGGRAEIQRNELANRMGCVPSQINYVLTTRFSVDKGYVIESKRGGGGCITVAKIVGTKDDLLPELLKQIDEMDSLTYNRAVGVTDRLSRDGILTDGESAIIKSALSDRALAAPMAEKLRKNVFKEILIGLIRR